jgi:allophanate hydrolase subunit 2
VAEDDVHHAASNQLARVRPHHNGHGKKSMRSILALALGLSIITLSGSADAATAHRLGPYHGHLRSGQRVAVRQNHDREDHYRERYTPDQGAVAARHFAVPGWTDAQTSKWLYDASAGSGKY